MKNDNLGTPKESWNESSIGYSVHINATATNRKRHKLNQDSADTIENRNAGIRGVAVADGLGGYSYARMASEQAVRKMKFRILALQSPDEIDLQNLFQQTHQDLIEYWADYCAQQGISPAVNKCFKTTLIVALETEQYIYLGYVGNGCIWSLRPSSMVQIERLPFPWTATNLLNPHVKIGKRGKEVLTRYLSPESDPARTP